MDSTKLPRDNAFDSIRLLLALGVVYAHSRYLFGAPDLLHWEAKGFDNLHLGTICVWGFFAISGFLVTASWYSTASLSDFLMKRFRRIFPGFWASLFICALLFAPIWYFIRFKTLSGFFDTYGLHLWKFISSNADSNIDAQAIGDLAIDTVNGPLWTIHHELGAYLFLSFILGLLMLIGISNIKKQRMAILLITLCLTSVRIYYTYSSTFAHHYSEWFGDERVLLFFVIFMWGSTLYLFREHLKPCWEGACASFSLLITATYYEFLPIIFPICFSYLLICLCYFFPLKNLGEKIGDISFGIYLYHWPVRLTLQMLGFQQELGLWSFLLLNIACTLPLAFLSWNFVEKRFLAHKKRDTNSTLEVSNVSAQSAA